MPTNLTGNTIASTYDQLLHIDGGPTATPQTVYSGTGTATVMKLGTVSVEFENIKLDGNTISSVNTNGDLNFTPNGSGVVNITNVNINSGVISGITDLAIADGGTGASTAADARTNLGLGTMATQNAGAVSITGGSITNVVFTGSFTGITLIESDKFSTKNGSDGISIEDDNIYAEGTSADIDINITPKGTGEVNVTNIDVISGKVPFNTITNRAYASFYDADTADQTGSTTDRTAVQWATAAVTGAGITVASNSRITLAAAGTYRINASLQLQNADVSDHDVTFWFAKNGTNIANSTSRITVPKTGDGGKAVFAIEIFETVAANDYIEMYWYPENANVTLHYQAAVAANPGVTPAIPATPPAIVVAERIA